MCLFLFYKYVTSCLVWMLTQAYVKGRWKGKRMPRLQADPWRENGEWEGEVKGKIGREGGVRPQA